MPACYGVVLKAIDKGQTSGGCKELDQFTNEVIESRGKKIGTADAATILAKASDIQIALGC